MLSVCIITKNEKQNIRRCLEALAPYDFELVVADTGSTDGTLKIAREYTDRVYEFSWRDDFAAAKNFAISKATREFVMVVDADEFLEPVDADRIGETLAMLKQNPDMVGRVYRRNVFVRDGQEQENDEWLNRIFARDKFCYEGRIHEQLVERDGSAYETFCTGFSFVYTGYDLPEEQRKEKAMRNIRLLVVELEQLEKKAMEQETTADFVEKITYVLYQLGKGYYMAGDYAKACDYFARALSYDLNPKLEYVIDMVETYGYALINCGRAGDALFFQNIYEEFGQTADFQFLMGLIYMNNELFDAAVQEFKKATTHRECRSRGVNSYAAYYNIGVIYECLGEAKEAQKYYRKCGTYEPALRRLSTDN